MCCRRAKIDQFRREVPIRNGPARYLCLVRKVASFSPVEAGQPMIGELVQICTGSNSHWSLSGLLDIQFEGVSLLEGLDQDWSQDLKLLRECGAAEHLARVALGVFRKLVSLSKMSPTQFHRLLPEGKEESEKGLRMMELAAEW